MSEFIPTVVALVKFNGATIGTIDILPDGTIKGKLSEVAHLNLIAVIRDGYELDLSFTLDPAHPG